MESGIEIIFSIKANQNILSTFLLDNHSKLITLLYSNVGKKSCTKQTS